MSSTHGRLTGTVGQGQSCSLSEVSFLPQIQHQQSEGSFHPVCFNLQVALVVLVAGHDHLPEQPVSQGHIVDPVVSRGQIEQ